MTKNYTKAEQCATENYLPNPKADVTEYTEGFKCTPSEFEIIKTLERDDLPASPEESESKLANHK